jgi:microcystin-dependent protein
MSDSFIGQLQLFPYSYTPSGWLPCEGQWVAIQSAKALFSLLGTTFGGDGTTYFCLPDLRGRAALGAGTPPSGKTYTPGDKAGVEGVMLTQDALGPHAHELLATTDQGDVNDPTGAVLAQVSSGTLQGKDKGNIYNPGSPNWELSGSTIVPLGGQQVHNNMQPSLALRYCISTVGDFPQRP